MQLEWLIIHNRLQYIADVLCSCESFELAYDLASDADLPITGPPVLLRWAQAVIDVLGTDSAACLAWLRKRLDSAAGVDWATVAGYALVRSLSCKLCTMSSPDLDSHGNRLIQAMMLCASWLTGFPVALQLCS